MSPISKPVSGSTTQIMSVGAMLVSILTEVKSAVVFPFPNAMAAVSLTYLFFPLTAFWVSFKRVTTGLEEVVVAVIVVAAWRFVALTIERTPPSGASQPRTGERSYDKEKAIWWRGVVVILRGGGGKMARVSAEFFSVLRFRNGGACQTVLHPSPEWEKLVKPSSGFYPEG